MPPVDISWKALFALRPEMIIALFNLLLCEQQILLLSNELGKLADVSEALLALLYPFKWCHTYIPLLPSLLSALRSAVSAPSPFLLGAHKRTAQHPPPMCGGQEDITFAIPQSVWQVDLDQGTVCGPGNNSFVSLSSSALYDSAVYDGWTSTSAKLNSLRNSNLPLPLEPLPQRLCKKLLERVRRVQKIVDRIKTVVTKGE
jgi:hypothetical protein